MYKSDGIKLADKAVASYRQQAKMFDTEASQLRSDLESINVELNETVVRLSNGIIRSLDTDDLQRISEETGVLDLSYEFDNLKKQRAVFEKRIDEIHQAEEFKQQEDLIHPVTGTYTQHLKESDELFKNIKAKCADYEFEEFQWLFKRGVHQEKKASAFGSFWRAVTLANYREEKALEKVAQVLNTKRSFYDLVSDYEEVKEQKVFIAAERNEWKLKVDVIKELIREESQKSSWVGDFETNALLDLRTFLAKKMAVLDFKEIHSSIRKGARILVSKCAALTEKYNYITQMKEYAEKESADRMTRASSINRVSQKWRRKPYSQLRGDKTKWLVDVPMMKHNGTVKRMRWMGTMRSNIYYYDNYAMYDHMMGYELGFLAYDAFSYRAEERMPYEGFSGTVIDDIGEFRDEYDQDKFDSSFYRQEERGMDDYPEDYDENWEDYEDEAYAEEAASEALMDEDGNSVEAEES